MRQAHIPRSGVPPEIIDEFGIGAGCVESSESESNSNLEKLQHFNIMRPLNQTSNISGQDVYYSARSTISKHLNDIYGQI